MAPSVEQPTEASVEPAAAAPIPSAGATWGAQLLLAALLVASGFAGLAYQVAWTRSLTSVTSATTTAQALVLAIFMGGLGLGSWLAGRAARRARAPLLGYAAVEVVAAALAALSPALIAASASVRTAATNAGATASLALAAQLVTVGLALFVITSLLGATLPLLVAHADRARGRAATSAGVIYGANTLGAAAGCLVAGFFSVEALGLTRTVWLGAALAVVAAVLAVVLAKLTPADPLVAAAPAPAPARAPSTAVLAASALGGALGLGGEVLWTRLVSLVVPSTVYAFSQVLFAVLLGIGLGALVAHRAHRAIGAHRAKSDTPADRAASALRLAGLAAVLAAVLVALIPLEVLSLSRQPELLADFAGGRSLVSLLVVTFVLLPASAALAALLPLLAASLAAEGHAAFGTLYTLNTLGSVAGSTLMGFVLLPALGLGGASLVLQVAALALGVALSMRAGERRAALRLAGLGGATVVLLHFSHAVPRQLYEERVGEEAEILELREGASSHVMVSQDRRTGRRLLWLNADWVAGTGGTHRALGHLPALLLDAPRRILGIALGTGQTFAAVVQHGAEHLDCVEIDAGVIALSRRWFGEANRGVLDAPNVTVHNDDGRAFLRSTRNRYDLVVLEPLQAWSAGTGNLYSREFYEEAQRVLAPGGVVAQWIPFYGQGPTETAAMVRTGLDVFAQGSLWIDGEDAILILSDARAGLALETLAARLEARHLGTLAQLGLGSAFDLASLFLMGSEDLRRWSATAPVLTDNRPLLEFRAAQQLGEDPFTRILATTVPYLTPPAQFFTATSTQAQRDLADAGQIRDALVRVQLVAPTDLEGSLTLLEAALPAGARAPAWRVYYREATLRLATSPAVIAAGPAAVERTYRRALDRVPDLAELAVNLALLQLQQDRFAEAEPLLRRAAEDPTVRAKAEQLLAPIAARRVQRPE